MVIAMNKINMKYMQNENQVSKYFFYFLTVKMKNKENDSLGVRRGVECPGGKLCQWDPEEVSWSLALGMSWLYTGGRLPSSRFTVVSWALMCQDSSRHL